MTRRQPKMPVGSKPKPTMVVPSLEIALGTISSQSSGISAPWAIAHSFSSMSGP